MSDLQCSDGLVLVHQVRHDSIQGALPLAGGTRAGAGVRSKLAQLFVLRLVGMRQGDFAAWWGVLAGEEDRVGHLLHGQVPDGAQGTSACGATSELGPTVGAYLRKDTQESVIFSLDDFLFVEWDKILGSFHGDKVCCRHSIIIISMIFCDPIGRHGLICCLVQEIHILHFYFCSGFINHKNLKMTDCWSQQEVVHITQTLVIIGQGDRT